MDPYLNLMKFYLWHRYREKTAAVSRALFDVSMSLFILLITVPNLFFLQHAFSQTESLVDGSITLNGKHVQASLPPVDIKVELRDSVNSAEQSVVIYFDALGNQKRIQISQAYINNVR